MNNTSRMKEKIESLASKIIEAYPEHKGIKPVMDGIVDLNEYSMSPLKILWILKEPHEGEKTGHPGSGGWDICKDFLAKDNFRELIKTSSSTWFPITYATFGILNDFKLSSDLPSIQDDPSMVSVVKKIAFINVSKYPGYTQSNLGAIRSAYNNHKYVLLNQISTYEPDIVIGGSTMDFFWDDLGVGKSDFKEQHPKRTYFAIKQNRIYIASLHPGQTKFKRNDYVDDIILAAQKFWTSRK